jgi:hypothetical protein
VAIVTGGACGAGREIAQPTEHFVKGRETRADAPVRAAQVKHCCLVRMLGGGVERRRRAQCTSGLPASLQT